MTDLAGNVKCSMTSAVTLTATGANQESCSQGTVTLANGNYILLSPAMPRPQKLRTAEPLRSPFRRPFLLH